MSSQETHGIWLAELRKQEHDLFLCAQGLPRVTQEQWLALVALHHQLDRLTHMTGEPMLAQIRHTWWRDLVEHILEGHIAAPHPLTPALKALLPNFDHERVRAWIASYLDRIGHAEFSGAAALAAHLRASYGALFAFGGVRLEEEHDAWHALGTAWGLTELLRRACDLPADEWQALKDLAEQALSEAKAFVPRTPTAKRFLRHHIIAIQYYWLRLNTMPMVPVRDSRVVLPFKLLVG